MLNKEEKANFKYLEEAVDSLKLDKFRINNEKLIVEKELEEVRKQLDDFKGLVNHLTSRKVVSRRNDEITESFMEFLYHNSGSIRY
jgi:hypothetical protein